MSLDGEGQKVKSSMAVCGMVCDHKMPESFSAFCRIVSFTAANTSLIFDVSVACVKLDLISESKRVISDIMTY